MRLIDADAVLAEITDYLDEYSEVDGSGLHNPKWCAMEEAKDVILNASTVDAVPVVRCKECVFWLRDKGHSLNGECECACIDGWWLPEEYCACGERRDDDASD